MQLQQLAIKEQRELVDRLREIGLDAYVELPQIAIMGDTSSGKSSLLSALSGVSFPSSDQLTTRYATQLILNRSAEFRGSVRVVRFRQRSAADAITKKYANRDDCATDNSTIEDYTTLSCLDDVPTAIEALTHKLVAEGQYISDDQIVIEMCGPELPNLTLTDLLGLVRTVGDDEDRSIIQRVRQLVGRYMLQERTVITAVVPANVDMHNTEILQAAQEADPKGHRTIAVVTKLDLVDAGVEQAVHELLMSNKKKMRLGYHAVNCRSQRDLNTDVSISASVASERAFFTQHEYWRSLEPSIWGVQHLTKRFVTILQDNIQRSLPKVTRDINDRIDATQRALTTLGEALETPSARRQQFGQRVNAYVRYMEAAVNGKYDALQMRCRPAAWRDRVDATRERHTTPSAIHQMGRTGEHENDMRLCALLRTHEREFQRAIEVVKPVPYANRSRRASDVRVGDTIDVRLESDTWQRATVLECQPHGI